MKDEISLNYYFSSLWNNKIIILLAIILAIIFGSVHNSFTTKYYEVVQEFRIDNVAYNIDHDLALFNLKKIRNTEENFIQWSKLTGQNIISFNDLLGTSNIKITEKKGFIYTSTEINKLKYLQLYNEYCSKLLSKQTVVSINDANSRAIELIKELGNSTYNSLTNKFAFTSNTSDEIKYDILIFDVPHKPTERNNTKNIYVIYIILFLLLTFIVLSINILSNNQKE